MNRKVNINVCVKKHVIHTHIMWTFKTKLKRMIFMWYTNDNLHLYFWKNKRKSRHKHKNTQFGEIAPDNSALTLKITSIHSMWSTTITLNTQKMKNMENSKWKFLPRKTQPCRIDNLAARLTYSLKMECC